MSFPYPDIWIFLKRKHAWSHIIVTQKKTSAIGRNGGEKKNISSISRNMSWWQTFIISILIRFAEFRGQRNTFRMEEWGHEKNKNLYVEASVISRSISSEYLKTPPGASLSYLVISSLDTFSGRRGENAAASCQDLETVVFWSNPEILDSIEHAPPLS